MKRFLVIMSVFAAVLFVGRAQAQISVNINIGSQPEWGPSGYNHVDYYYLPDINAYYDVATAQYIYLLNNRWRFAKKLPGRYKKYDVYNAYKVVVNREKPYQNNKQDIQKYAQYKGHTGQPMLRDNKQYETLRNQKGNSSGKRSSRNKDSRNSRDNGNNDNRNSDHRGR